MLQIMKILWIFDDFMYIAAWRPCTGQMTGRWQKHVVVNSGFTELDTPKQTQIFFSEKTRSAFRRKGNIGILRKSNGESCLVLLYYRFVNAMCWLNLSWEIPVIGIVRPPFLYYSHTTPIRIAWSIGIVWETYGKGVSLLGFPGEIPKSTFFPFPVSLFGVKEILTDWIQKK